MDCTMRSLRIFIHPCSLSPWNQAPWDTIPLPIHDFILRWSTGKSTQDVAHSSAALPRTSNQSLRNSPTTNLFTYNSILSTDMPIL